MNTIQEDDQSSKSQNEDDSDKQSVTLNSDQEDTKDDKISIEAC